MADNESPEANDDALYALAYLGLRPVGRKIGDAAMTWFEKWWNWKTTNEKKTLKGRASKEGLKGGKELMKLRLEDQSTNRTKKGVSFDQCILRFLNLNHSYQQVAAYFNVIDEGKPALWGRGGVDEETQAAVEERYTAVLRSKSKSYKSYVV